MVFGSIGDTIDKAKDTTNDAYDGVKDGVSDVSDKFNDGIEKAKDSFKEVGDIATGDLPKKIDEVSGVSDTVDFIEDTGSGVRDVVTQPVEDPPPLGEEPDMGVTVTGVLIALGAIAVSWVVT